MAAYLRITARRDGHRRAGIAHPGRAVDHRADRFTAEQVEALRADPQLVVHDVDLSDEEGGEEPDQASAKKPRTSGAKGNASKGGN